MAYCGVTAQVVSSTPVNIVIGIADVATMDYNIMISITDWCRGPTLLSDVWRLLRGMVSPSPPAPPKMANWHRSLAG